MSDFNPLKFIEPFLWPSISSILENVPHALDRDVYPPVVGWGVPCMFMRSIDLECIHVNLLPIGSIHC